MSKPRTQRQAPKPQPIQLDPRPSRPLTSRECARLIGGTVGTLCNMAAMADVAAALRWWAQHLEALPKLGEKSAQREPSTLRGENGKA